ncbi:MAG: hypothetical protein E7555_01870 [Ruminococcaceae bacterium]|nr:hypothetical protein [Oscillospiraceae bacterium]
MKKLLALLMAGIMLFAFAACGGNGEEETTTNPEEITTEAPANADVEETTADEEETEEVTEVVTNDEGEAVTDKDGDVVTEKVTEKEEKTDKTEKPSKEDSKKPTQSTSKKPSSTAEIVEYFNKAVNGVKTGAKSVKQHSIVNYLASPTKIGDGLSGIYKMLGGDDWLDGMLQSNSTGEATYTGSDIKKNFPVENESWASKLTASDVSSATCTEKDGVYTIKIVTKADAKTTTVKHGQGHNPKVFSVVLPATINENIPGIAKGITGDVAMNYPSGSATITVDAATGHVLTAFYDAHWTINFDKMATSLPFATKFTYTINW